MIQNYLYALTMDESVLEKSVYASFDIKNKHTKQKKIKKIYVIQSKRKNIGKDPFLHSSNRIN